MRFIKQNYAGILFGLCIAVSAAIFCGCSQKSDSGKGKDKNSTPVEESTTRKTHVAEATNHLASYLRIKADIFLSDNPQDSTFLKGVFAEEDEFGNEMLKEYPELFGMEYLIVMMDDGSIESVFCAQTSGKKESIGCAGKIKDIDDLGVSDWDELVRYYTDPTYERPPVELLTKTFTVDDIYSYDRAVFPEITVTGDKYAIENFNVGCSTYNPNLGVGMIGYLGEPYGITWKYGIESAVITFTYVPDLLYITDLSEEVFQPAIYYYNEETQFLEELQDQTIDGCRVTAPLKTEKEGYYMLLNKIDVDEFMEGWGTDIEY